MANRMQIDRRRDTVPWTWEPFVGVVLAYVLVVLAAAQLARSAAYLLSGDGWQWPTQDTQVTSAIPIFAGHATAGLPGRHVPNIGHPLLVSSLIVFELAALLALTAVLLEAVHRWGSARMFGMATHTDAEHLLGVTRLRGQAPVIRPDLYTRRIRQTAASASGEPIWPVQQTPSARSGRSGLRELRSRRGGARRGRES